MDFLIRVKAILDANRNSLMLLDLKFSIGTLGIGSGAFIAALYGMNLKNFIEESDLGFFGISALSFVFAGVICSYGLTKLRKVQRVTMWGESGRRGKRGSWRDLDLPSPTSSSLSPPSSSLSSSSSAASTPSPSTTTPSFTPVFGGGHVDEITNKTKNDRPRFHEARQGGLISRMSSLSLLKKA